MLDVRYLQKGAIVLFDGFETAKLDLNGRVLRPLKRKLGQSALPRRFSNSQDAFGENGSRATAATADQQKGELRMRNELPDLRAVDFDEGYFLFYVRPKSGGDPDIIAASMRLSASPLPQAVHESWRKLAASHRGYLSKVRSALRFKFRRSR